MSITSRESVARFGWYCLGQHCIRPMSRSPTALMPIRFSSTKVDCMGPLVGKLNGMAAAQLLAVIMQDWKYDRQRFEAERQQRFEAEHQCFEAERDRFYHEENDQAVQIAEMKKDVLHMREEYARHKQGFTVRGGLECICHPAVLDKRIPNVSRIQEKLDSLPSTDAFIEIDKPEIVTWKLAILDDERGRENNYHEPSKHARGNDQTILIHRQYFTAHELAVIMSYYKMQNSWKNPSRWAVVGGK